MANNDSKWTTTFVSSSSLSGMKSKQMYVDEMPTMSREEYERMVNGIGKANIPDVDSLNAKVLELESRLNNALNTINKMNEVILKQVEVVEYLTDIFNEEFKKQV